MATPPEYQGTVLDERQPGAGYSEEPQRRVSPSPKSER